MHIIRKIIIGVDPKDGMAYYVGMRAGGGTVAAIMLDEIAKSGRAVGFKPAGGLKSASDAFVYLDLADRILGSDWATPATFRFGASSVLDALLAAAEGKGAEETEGY